MARDLTAGRFLIPDPVVVTLTRPASPSFLTPSVAVVQRVQEQHADEADAESGLDATARIFHLWRAETPGLMPHRGCLITSPTGTYEIQRVEILAHGERYRCHCSLRHPRP